MLTLNNDYRIKRSDNGKRLDIFSIRRKRKVWLLYSAEKDRQDLFIYAPNKSGYRISFDQNNLVLHRNRSPLYKLEKSLNKG